MTAKEQKEMKNYYDEAMRYMDNAKGYLQNAQKDGKFYRDTKYVKTACGTAYNGVLVALDGYLAYNGIKKTKGRKSIEFYQENVAKLNRKMLDSLNSTYNILHLSGYYDGINNADVIKVGFDYAYKIINAVKTSNGQSKLNGHE